MNLGHDGYGYNSELEVKTDIENGAEIETPGETEVYDELEAGPEIEYAAEEEDVAELEYTGDTEVGVETENDEELEVNDETEAEGGLEVNGDDEELEAEGDAVEAVEEKEDDGPKFPSFGGDSLQDQLNNGAFGQKFRPGLGLKGLLGSGALGGSLNGFGPGEKSAQQLPGHLGGAPQQPAYGAAPPAYGHGAYGQAVAPYGHPQPYAQPVAAYGAPAPYG